MIVYASLPAPGTVAETSGQTRLGKVTILPRQTLPYANRRVNRIDKCNVIKRIIVLNRCNLREY